MVWGGRVLGGEGWWGGRGGGVGSRYSIHHLEIRSNPKDPWSRDRFWIHVPLEMDFSCFFYRKKMIPVAHFLVRLRRP